ncbi:unnamed protein product [Parnassius apollo]|uniref:(apollo) hypothetical protein n=1 Tax=Parnassius apollo TaxID=110799 RepID=A0A8S3XQU2_PARAO|nr:unnamed protein product [Parnassius apollo]
MKERRPLNNRRAEHTPIVLHYTNHANMQQIENDLYMSSSDQSLILILIRAISVKKRRNCPRKDIIDAVTQTQNQDIVNEGRNGHPSKNNNDQPDEDRNGQPNEDCNDQPNEDCNNQPNEEAKKERSG